MKLAIGAATFALLLVLLGGIGGAPGPVAAQGMTSDCSVSFTDVSSDSPVAAYVQCLVCRNIISSFADGTFQPNAKVTRGDLVRVVVQAAGYDDVIPATQQTFVDVPPSNPNWLYIERGAAHGLIQGYQCGTDVADYGACPGRYFKPERYAIRAQTAKLVTLAAGYTDAVPDSQQTFNEVPRTHPYWLYVERAVNHGLVSGYPCDNTTYNVCGKTIENCPGVYYRCCFDVTRGQLAKFVAAAFFPACVTGQQ
jgi:hypothetical protein